MFSLSISSHGVGTPKKPTTDPIVDDLSGMDKDNGTDNSGSSIVTLEPYTSLNKGKGGAKSKNQIRNPVGNVDKREKFKKMEIIPGVYEIVNYDKFLILEFEEGRHETVNVFKANREIIALCGGQPKIRPQGNGSLLIETSSPEQSEKLQTIKILDGHQVKCISHPVFNQSRGVVYAPELLHIEEKEIEEELKNQGIIKVVRMRKKIGEQLVPLGTLILTFNQCRLPKYISAGWLSLKVKPYIPSPLRCYHCQKFGHLHQKCRDLINEKPATCSNCGKESHGKCNETPSCINCGEQHPSSSKSCVKFIFEKEVQAIRTLEKTTFKDARKKALEKQIRPGELFSTVLKKIREKPQPVQVPKPENTNQPVRVLPPPLYKDAAKGKPSSEPKGVEDPAQSLEIGRDEAVAQVPVRNSYEVLTEEDEDVPSIEVEMEDEIDIIRKKRLRDQSSPPKVNENATASKKRIVKLHRQTPSENELLDDITPSPVYQSRYLNIMKNAKEKRESKVCECQQCSLKDAVPEVGYHHGRCGCHNCFLKDCKETKPLTKDKLMNVIRNFFSRKDSGESLIPLDLHTKDCMCIKHLHYYRINKISYLDNFLVNQSYSDSPNESSIDTDVSKA